MTEQQQAQDQASEAQDQESASEENSQEQVSGETTTDDSSLQQQIADLRKEAAKYRTERNALQAKEEERTNAEKSEIEKAQGEVAKRDERISSLEGRLKRSSFIEQYGERGRLAWATANDLGLEVEFDDDLKATNVDQVRKELKKQEPSVFGDGPADAGNKNGGGGGYQGSPGQERIAHAYSINK